MRSRLEQQRRGRHPAGRHVATARPADAVRRVRAIAGAVIATLCLVVSVSVMPVQSTLASFTDAESVAATSITAARFEPLTNLSCSPQSRLLVVPGVELSWTPVAGAVPATSYTVTVKGPGQSPISTSVTDTQRWFSLSELSISSTGQYVITVTARSDKAPAWTSAGATATFTKSVLNLSNRCA